LKNSREKSTDSSDEPKKISENDKTQGEILKDSPIFKSLEAQRKQ
jgi:hypothetical protein